MRDVAVTMALVTVAPSVTGTVEKHRKDKWLTLLTSVKCLKRSRLVDQASSCS